MNDRVSNASTHLRNKLVNYSGFAMATATLFLHLFVLLFIWGGFGTFTETHVRTYFLSSDYKSLAKPKQSL